MSNTLTVTTPATITVVVGKILTITATATASTPTPAPTFQWYKGTVSTPISGATSATFTVTSVASTDAATYIVVATQVGTGPLGADLTAQSSTIVTVNPTMVVTAPTSITVKTGATATFTVSVTGGINPYTYQWAKNGTAISGAVGASYTTPATVKADNATTYACTVTDSDSPGTVVTSTAATLTVKSSIAWWVWALIAAAVVVVIIIIIVVILVITSSNAKKRKAAEEAAANAQLAPPVAQQVAYPPMNPALAARGGSRPYGM